MTCSRGAIAFLLAAVVLGPHQIWAQGQSSGPPRALPLRLTIQPKLPLPRSHAPIAAEVDLQWNGPGLLEGWLELEGQSVNKTVFRYRSEDLAIPTGGRRFGIMLPPVQLSDRTPLLRLQARFLTEEGPIELDEQVLRVPLNNKRECIAAICLATGQAVSDDRQQLAQSLQLERFNPGDESQNQLVTSSRFVAADDLPSDPLSYFSYDLLVLSADAFAELRGNQLEALLAWLKAGGSLCLMPIGDHRLTAAHVNFLNEVAAATPGSPPAFILGDDGHLKSSERNQEAGPSRRLAMHRTGLGRAVLLDRVPDTKPESDDPPWREAVLFLWKVRCAQVPAILKSGVWNSVVRTPKEQWSPGGGYNYDLLEESVFAPKRLNGWDNLAWLLLPESTSGVPMIAVIAILVTFLLAIAPGDYLLLGYLRRRKYTWLLFPALSILFTLFTVQLAQRYMGTADQRKALVIIDVAEGNRIARTTRYELLFTAAQKEVDIPLKRTVFTPLDDRGLQLPDVFEQDRITEQERGRFGEPEGPRTIVAEPPLFAGVLPYAYSAVYEMQQWTPRLNRQTTIGGGTIDLAFDFDAVAATDWDDEGSRRALTKAIKKAVPDCKATICQGGQGHALAGAPSSERNAELFDLVERASARGPKGMLALVSQTSPVGGRYFEDLAVLDMSDVRQSLLLVLKETENEVIVYRRVYFDRLARGSVLQGHSYRDHGFPYFSPPTEFENEGFEPQYEDLLFRKDGEIVDGL